AAARTAARRRGWPPAGRRSWRADAAARGRAGRRPRRGQVADTRGTTAPARLPPSGGRPAGDTDEASPHQELGDLDAVRGGTLAQVVGDHEQAEAVAARGVVADASHEDIIRAGR